MTREEFDRAVLERKHRKPFRPFTVALTSGDRFDVDCSDAFSCRHGVAVFLAPKGRPWLFDFENVSQIIDTPPETKD